MRRPLLTQTSSSRRTSQVTRREKLHSLIAVLRPAISIPARRIAFPLLLLTAGLAIAQPCAGQGGTWTTTGSMSTATMLQPSNATSSLNGRGQYPQGGGD